MANLTRIPATGSNGQLRVVVEAPRGSQVKLKYAPELKTFQYVRPLPLGLSYPYDWGFVPSTCGEDGDPLDGLVVMHPFATVPGTVIECRVVGVLQVAQTERGRTLRNDRFLCAPVADTGQDVLHAIGELKAAARRELESFFCGAVQGTGKRLRFLGWKGSRVAMADIRRGMQAFRQGEAPVGVPLR